MLEPKYDEVLCVESITICSSLVMRAGVIYKARDWQESPHGFFWKPDHPNLVEGTSILYQTKNFKRLDSNFPYGLQLTTQDEDLIESATHQ